MSGSRHHEPDRRDAGLGAGALCPGLADEAVPLGVPQVIVLGEYEEYVPLSLARTYVQAAERTGDRVRLMVIPGVGHFEIASPRAAIWPGVESAIRSLIDGKLPTK